MLPEHEILPPEGMEDPALEEMAQEVADTFAQADQELRVATSSEFYNLANRLDETQREQIAKDIFNGFDEDDKTRTQWMEDHAYWLRLYMQQDAAVNADAERSWGATESIPILTEACDQFQARTYKIFFPQDNFVSAIPVRKTKKNRKILEDRADRVGNHMSYQLGVKNRQYKSDKDALFLAVAVHGSFFTKTYFDLKTGAPKIDNVRPTDLVINHNYGPIRIEDARRKTHIIYTTVGETEDLVAEEYFVAAAKPAQQQGDNQYNVSVDEAHGLTRSNDSVIKRDAPAVLLEQQFYYALDEGRYLPYIGTICAASRKLLRLAIDWEADETGQPLNDYKQIKRYTHYKYKNNPDGFYGLGLGHTMGDLNGAANIMLRQTIDAATLANEGNMSGFISSALGITGDEIRFSLGKFRTIEDSVGDLQKGLFQFQFPGPNPALIELMQKIDERAQRLGSTTEATTGTPSRAEQATTYLASIEQALESFSAVQMRLADALGDELQIIYRLNQRYLPTVDYYVVNDEPEQIARADYADDMMIMPVFDPRYTTRAQKVARAQAELQGTLQNPVNQARPQVIDAAFRRYFEALEVENVEELIPPPPQVENFDDQITENMFFLMPKEGRPPFDVFPEQDHARHIAELKAFVKQYGEMLQPDQQEDIQKHYMKHQAYLYGQQHGIIEKFPPDETPALPMGERSGNGVGNGAAEPGLSADAGAYSAENAGGSPFEGGAAAGAAPDSGIV